MSFFGKKIKQNSKFFEGGGFPPGGPSAPSEGAFGSLGGPLAPLGCGFLRKIDFKNLEGGVPPWWGLWPPQRGIRSPRGAFGPHRRGLWLPLALCGALAPPPPEGALFGSGHARPAGMARNVPTHTHTHTHIHTHTHTHTRTYTVTKLTVSIIDCSIFM